MTIRWKAVEQYFVLVLFVFQFCPGSNFGKFINFGLGTVRSKKLERAYKHGYLSGRHDQHFIWQCLAIEH